MKKLILVLFSILFTLQASSQQFEITQTDYPYEGKIYESVHLSINADKDDAKKAWNSFIQDLYNVDIKGYGLFAKKDELKTELIPMSFLSSEALVLHTHFSSATQGSEIVVYASRPNGNLLSKEVDSLTFENLESLTEEFVSYFLPDYHRERVDMMSEDYRDILNDIEDKKKEVVEKTNKIEALEAEIKSLEREIIESNEKKELAKKRLDKSRTILNKVKKSTSKL